MSRPMPPLAQRLRAMLPAGVAVAAADPRAEVRGLRPAERAAIATAIPRRQREFAAGRRAARAAMTQLGLAETALGMGPDRAPLWPEDVVGCITHDDRACLAALARRATCRGIGIDIEPARPLAADLRAETCAAEGWLARMPEPEAGLMARAVFSAKESWFKAQFPLTGAWVGFDAVRVEQAAEGLMLTPVAPELTRLGPVPCACRIDPDHVITALIL